MKEAIEVRSPQSRQRAQVRLRRMTGSVALAATASLALIGVLVAKEHPGSTSAATASSHIGSSSSTAATTARTSASSSTSTTTTTPSTSASSTTPTSTTKSATVTSGGT